MSEEALELDEEIIDTPEEIEAATDKGWKAEEDWKGDPPRGGFKTAKEFLETDGKANTVLKDRNEKLIEDLAGVKETMALLVKDTATQRDRALQKERAAHEKEKAQLVSQLTKARRDAIAEGDVEQAEAIDGRLEEVKNDPAPQGPNPEFLQWRTENAWYSENGEAPSSPEHAEMSAAADVIAAQLSDTGRYRTYASLLGAVKLKIQREFPEQFANPNREEPGATETTKASKKSEKQGYGQLPADAKAACDSFVKDIPGYTKEQYLKTYEWED